MADSYFVRLEDPRHLKLAVLSSSRSVLEIAKAQLYVQKIAERKREVKGSLKEELQQLTGTVSRLQERLPHGELLAEYRKRPKRSEPESRKSKEEDIDGPRKAPSADLDKLNDAIDAIERKLASLK